MALFAILQRVHELTASLPKFTDSFFTLTPGENIARKGAGESASVQLVQFVSALNNCKVRGKIGHFPTSTTLKFYPAQCALLPRLRNGANQTSRCLDVRPS